MPSPKRVLFISQVYAPSYDAISQMNAGLAKGLSEKGWDVHVLTNQVNYMTGERLLRHERIDGVRVWRTPCLSLRREHPAARMAMYGGFFLASGPALSLIPKPDVAVYLSTPPLAAWSAAPFRALCSVKTVYWAQDVYPDVPVQMGYLKNPVLKRVLFAAEKKIVRRMDRLAVIGNEMGQVFRNKGVPQERIVTIPNWSVVDVAPGGREQNEFLTQHGLGKKFVVQYSGNMGVVHDMAAVADAMVRTVAEPDIHWLVIGDGKRRHEVEAAVEKRRLAHVTMLPYQPVEKLPQSLSAADVALVSLRPEMEGLVVPSKLYGAMAAGVPIVFIGSPKGEVAQILRRHNCGATVSNGEALAREILHLRDNPNRRQALGRNARAAYEQHYAKAHGIRRFDEVLSQVVNE